MSHDQVIIVDKPAGMTSHDVVARLRRILKQKGVGHAGTLDPLATGVLVLLSGQATKLAQYLTADDKVYSATIRLGVATDSLDADGAVLSEVALASPLLDALARHPEPTSLLSGALATELARTSQVPPSVSAIHVDGQRAHALARKLGAEAVVLPPRAVHVRGLAITGVTVDPPSIDVELHVDKGYYVRAFARDFAEALGTVGHVSRLRRLASGTFTLADATAVEAAALRPIAMATAATRALPVARLTALGVTLARHGKALPADSFESPPARDVATAWLGPDGDLVAVGHFGGEEAGTGKVARGFSPETNASAQG
jgi:tRNA pseudouridine55 synthase